MQEKQVTIGEETHKLEEPFLVLATQNPIEQKELIHSRGAVDRFMLKVVVGYPTRSEEQTMIIRQQVHRRGRCRQ
jgi:MoxR-like ATPase